MAAVRLQRLTLSLIGFVAGLALVSTFWGVWFRPRQPMSLYWLSESGGNTLSYVVQERRVPASNSSEAIASALELLINPNQANLISAVPPTTQVLGVRTEGNDVFLDFSADFASGGGSASVLGRIVQVLYTATSQNPEARVWISINGEALEVLSGEGLMLDQPLTRESFRASLQQP